MFNLVTIVKNEVVYWRGMRRATKWRDSWKNGATVKNGAVFFVQN
jgi:hypothetical protein